MKSENPACTYYRHRERIEDLESKTKELEAALKAMERERRLNVPKEQESEWANWVVMVGRALDLLHLADKLLADLLERSKEDK